MTRLTVTGRLTASDENRTLRGRLIPYDRPGYTNLGRVIVHPGGIDVPEDVSTLFASLDHLDGRDSVAEFVRIDNRADGLHAEWLVPLTHGGDRLLAEFADGIRTGISVELEPVAIRDGVATGRLIGCAFPIRPAFSDARLIAELAPDTEPDDAADAGARSRTVERSTTPEDAPEAPEDSPEDAPEAPEDSPEAPEAPEPERNTMPNRATAAAPADLLPRASAPDNSTPTRLTASNAEPADVYRILAELATAGGANRARLTAELSDIVPGNLLDREQPQWLGQLWAGRSYTRRIVPLLASGELTGLKVAGWRWANKPAMAKYDGNKAAVPSNAAATEPYSQDAQRFAGAHDIDRKYVDFRDDAFFASYFAAMTDSYAKLTDAYAVERMKEEALEVTPGAVPGDVPAGWAALVDAALEIVEVGTPSFALVEKSVYRDMLFTEAGTFLEFLNASIGFEEGTLNSNTFKIVPVAADPDGLGLDAGEILIGTRAAATFRELGGGTPIRVSALDLVNGGIDEGCFGYAAVDVHDARGLRIVDLSPDAP